ncbi:hypothetical protein Tco_0681484 [Tanacetum coccineum]|uniref:Uncharacterized protein n=1 Tax=Tanacetum coccineum TaxID=301880 RepID=A0ABQ4XPN6_9ASTR
MDIGTPCHEIISFIYNLVRVSILSVALVGMKFSDLGSNTGDSGNTRDEGKTVGGAIGAHGNGIGQKILDKSSKRSGEVFPGEAGKARKELEAQFSWSRDQDLVVDGKSFQVEVHYCGGRCVVVNCLHNKGWVLMCSGSNPGGGFRKPGGGRETHGGRDGLKGPGGQLSMDVVNEFSHLVVPHLRMSGGELVMLYERNVEKFIKTPYIGVDANALVRKMGELGELSKREVEVMIVDNELN